MKKYLLSLSVFVLSSSLFAQNVNFQMAHAKGEAVKVTREQRCGTDKHMEMLKQSNPNFEQEEAERRQVQQEWIANHYNAWNAQRAIITIPTVFHIWEDVATLPDLRVTEQLNTLNEDFRRLNSDASNTPTVFAAVAADTEIEFCLASEDPNGVSTTGIIRHTGSPSDADMWSRNDYLNVFVYNLGGGVLGFAQFPGGAAGSDRVNISTSYFGSTGAQAPYNGGRTATHEVGHWLGLRHIWGDSNCGNDQIADTPTQQSDNGGCPSHPYNVNSCGTNADGEMFMNYMDYVNDACMNMFTEGQKAAMVSVLNTTRSSLLSSTGCAGQAASPDADFTASSVTIMAGESVDFTDQSLNISTSGWSYNWTFTGGTPSSSTDQNPMGVVYANPGTFEVSLTIDSAGVTDTETKSDYIIVIDPNAPQSCESLNFPLSGTATLYGDPNGGYVSGNSSYNDKAKADFFDNYGLNSYITGAYFQFGAANATDANSVVQVKVWEDSNGEPGTELSSQDLHIQTIVDSMANNSLVYVGINNVPITGNFYIGVELSYNGTDTVALVTNTDGDMNPGIAWEKWSDDSWVAYNEAGTGWGIEVGHAIYPVVCTKPSGLNESGVAKEFIVFPNPTNGMLNVDLSAFNSNVQVDVINVVGELIYSAQVNTGQSLYQLDLQNNAKGIYFVNVKSNDGISTKKVLLK